MRRDTPIRREAWLVLVLSAALAVGGCSGSGQGSTGPGGTTGQAGGAAGTGGIGGAGGGAAGATGAAGKGGSGPGTGGGGRGGSGGGDRGGSGGGGGDPFAGAMPITVGASATSGTLAGATKPRNVYSFAGMMGEAIQILTSTGAADPFDPTYLDLAITLYGPDRLQFAQQADPWPRDSVSPRLYTVLPATGTYYLVVESCVDALVSPCVYSNTVSHKEYTVTVSDLAPPILIGEGAEPGNNAVAGAAALISTKAGGTSYVPLVVNGLLQNKNDQDIFTFTVPADAPVAAGTRARANFWFQPTREDGNGSSYGVGTMYVTDPADTSGAHIVEIDAVDFGNGQSADRLPANMSFPVQLGKQYALVVTHSSFSPDPLLDFYFLQHLGGAPAGSPPVEQQANNDTQATAETLTGIANGDGTHTFAVDGDLSPPTTDVDFYKLQVPAGLTTLTGSCASIRYGSGVAGFKLEVVDASGTVVRRVEEFGNADRTLGLVTIPTGGAVVKVSATMQFAGITNSSYICRFVVKA